MKKVINKGYTITVTSWENDGDNYNTNSITVGNKELAKAYYDMMQLCTSKNNQSKGVIRLGNSCDFKQAQLELIRDFLLANPILMVDNEISDEDDDLEEYGYLFSSLVEGLLGSSEYYACRVMQSCDITYSTEDIYLETITF